MAAASSREKFGSFRDPAGFIFHYNGALYRQVNRDGQEDYEALMSSGLYRMLSERRLLVPHREVTLTGLSSDTKRHKILKPERIPFVSYPYEWTFDQLKAAAIATLEIMRISLQHNMILKDASAYNVQFIGSQPILLDTLSFAKYTEGDQWEGYRQFCEHFVAPLALAHYASMDTLKTQQVFLDGMPLTTVCKMLPRRARMKPGLLAHLYIHGAAQRRHQRGGEVVAAKAKERRMSSNSMLGLLASLERTIKKLRAPEAKTEWGEYYTFTNYSDKAFKAKRKTVQDLLRRVTPAPAMVWDIGANNGEFSEVAAEMGMYTVAFDIDTNAVSRNYHAHRDIEVKHRMLPLVQDLTNPSPALGWSHDERSSLVDRGPADVVMALALIHHLCIGNNVPFDKVAQFLSQIGRNIIIEFVPKGDSKVDHLLASRKDIFTDYDAEHFEAAMSVYFRLVDKVPVRGSKRSIYLYKHI